MREIARKRLDITGTVIPLCLLAIRKKAKVLKPSDELIITCDTLPRCNHVPPPDRPRCGHDRGFAPDLPDIREITLEKTIILQA